MDSRRELLAVLTKHADNGWVCPTLVKLAEMLGLRDQGYVSKLLLDLRKAGKITQRLTSTSPWGQARVVTIVATGRSTKEPVSTRKRAERPTFAPTSEGLTSAGRFLEGSEFAKRAAELEAIDREDRRKREARV